MFKKIAKISIIGFIISINLFTYTAFAADIQKPLSPFFQREMVKDGVVSKVNLVNNLPEKSIPVIIGSVIKMILSIAGSLALISFTVGGIMMLSANGADEKITKGKMIILWSVIALAIMAASFAVVTGVTELSKNFYTSGGSNGGQQQSGDADSQNLAPGSEDLTAKEKQEMSKKNL